MFCENSLSVTCIYTALFWRSQTGVSLRHPQETHSHLTLNHQPTSTPSPQQLLFKMLGTIKAFFKKSNIRHYGAFREPLSLDSSGSLVSKDLLQFILTVISSFSLQRSSDTLCYVTVQVLLLHSYQLQQKPNRKKISFYTETQETLWFTTLFTHLSS